MRRVVGRLVGASAGASLATVAALRVADANSRASSSEEIKSLSTIHASQPFDAASSIAERGVTILHGVLSTEIQLDPRLDAASIAASAGAAMAAMLPTVHQADAWVRQSMGQQLASALPHSPSRSRRSRRSPAANKPSRSFRSTRHAHARALLHQ